MASDSFLRLRIWAENATRAGITGAWRGIRRLGTGIKRFSVNMARNVARGAKIAIGSLVAFAGIAVKLASDAEETGQKFSVVFKDVAKEADGVAKAFAKNFGLASDQSKKLLGDTGDILTGFGFTGEKALELAKNVNELAGDLASFTNIEGGVEVASKALTAALVGETERAKALGIVIRQDSKEFKTLVQEFQRGQGATLLQAKAQAALTIAFRQSQNAQGDYARTSQSLANRLRTIKNTFRGLTIEIGNQLIKGLDLNTLMGRLIKRLRDWTTELKESGIVQKWAERARKAFEQVKTVVDALFGDKEERRIVVEGLSEGAAKIAQTMASGFVALVLRWAPVIGNAMGKAIREGMTNFFRENERRQEAAVRLRQKGELGETRGERLGEVVKALFNTSEKIAREADIMRAEELRARGKALEAQFAKAGGAGQVWQNMLIELQRMNNDSIPKLRQPD